MTRFAALQLVSLLLIGGAAAATEDGCSDGTCNTEDDTVNQESLDEDDTVNLMQVNQQSHPHRGKSHHHQGLHSERGATCSDMKNQGAYFTVSVGIGAPAQNFNLVADTGSDALIIPDCRCVEHGYCRAISSCFAPEDSDSFALDEEKDKNGKALVLGAKMDYGSGEIQVLIGSDHVNVAGMGAHLHNGVFLMEDRRSLDVHGDFEGILGLGLPHKHPLTKDAVKIPSFMDEASEVKSYSLCFNEWPHPGAMRTSTQALQNPMNNLGQVHWGLAIDGFSIGGANTPVVLCDPAKKPANQQTACGAIPDSGTTLLMGPADHIHSLYASLCSQWDRCKTTVAGSADDHTKSRAFHNLLRECETWMGDAGVTEVPSIFIHMSGANGAKQAIEMTAWSYIVETTEDLFATVSEKLYGENMLGKKAKPLKIKLDAGNSSKESEDSDTKVAKKVCSGSFGPQDYNTKQNGPVWILGAPTFYAHRVGYSVKPPLISFMDSDCDTCSAKPSLIQTDGTRATKRPRALRKLTHIKESGIDTTKDFF